MGNIERGEIKQTSKHTAHIRYLRGIEAREIKHGKIRHIIKHTVHIRYFRGIEIGEIYL